jgi:hypothetical protein
MVVGRIFWSAGGNYYTIGAPIRTDEDPDPGTGECGSKLDGTMLEAGLDCYDTSQTPIPSVTYRTAKINAAWVNTGYTNYSTQLTETCGLFPYQAGQIGYTGLTQSGYQQFYVDEATIVSGTTYQLYAANTGSTTVVGANKYYSIILGTGSTFNYVVYITSSGIMSEWYACP